jgi:hypothetical protein
VISVSFVVVVNICMTSKFDHSVFLLSVHDNNSLFVIIDSTSRIGHQSINQ